MRHKLVSKICEKMIGGEKYRQPREEIPHARWELRVGDFRVFYDVNVEPANVVIVAVRHKVHKQVVYAW